jgi:hypothetical protein
MLNKLARGRTGHNPYAKFGVLIKFFHQLGPFIVSMVARFLGGLWNFQMMIGASLSTL